MDILFSLGFAGYFQALTGAPILSSAIALLAALSFVLAKIGSLLNLYRYFTSKLRLTGLCS